ncbi:hypothetical protein pb186bvf_005751 [Paramecium bursaria]
MKEIQSYEDYIYIILDGFREFTIWEILIILILILISYFMGKRRGRSDILIPKSLKIQIEKQQGQAQASIKQTQSLQAKIKRLETIQTWFLSFGVIILGSYIYMLYLEQQMNEIIYISLVFAPIYVGLWLYKIFEKRQLQSYSNLVKVSKQEIDEVGHLIAMKLGDNLLDLLKKQIFEKEQEQFRQLFLKENQSHIQKLKNRISELEQNEQSYIQTIQKNIRANSQHNTAPPQTQKVDQIQQKIDQYDPKKIENEFLKEELKIYADFVLQVSNFEWCGLCIEQKGDCLEKYFELSRKIGSDFNIRRNQLKERRQLKS